MKNSNWLYGYNLDFILYKTSVIDINYFTQALLKADTMKKSQHKRQTKNQTVL